MAATFTFGVFSSLDGYGSPSLDGDWGGYWGKQGPELLESRPASFEPEQRMVFGGSGRRRHTCVHELDGDADLTMAEATAILAEAAWLPGVGYEQLGYDPATTGSTPAGVPA